MPKFGFYTDIHSHPTLRAFNCFKDVNKRNLWDSTDNEVFNMDWNAARAHCEEKNWKWTLDLINKYQKEMKELKDENVKLKRQLVLRSQLNK